jgi:polar amino acid transport system substrate-binding protein
MTARAMASDREKCLRAGMDDYMSKPVTYEQLDTVLNKWLNGEAPAAGQQEKIMEREVERQSLNFSPEMQNAQAAPVDLTMLREMLGEEETADILKLFVTSTEELMDKINQALAQRDAQALREAAHTLKGACSSIGANEMWRECIELEQAAKSADWTHIPEMYSELSQTFDQAKAFIHSKF